MNISDAAFHLETQIALAEDEVHLWRIDLAGVASGEQRWRQILSVGERERADRFHFSIHRQYFTATRALLRIILGSYVDSDPTEVIFQYSEKEKPSLSPSQHARQVEFNVSHSGTMAILAFARGRALGVDVEQLRNNFDHDAIARRFFSEEERRQLNGLPPSERNHGFFRCWTRKEAYIKAQGAGLSLPLHQFDVSLKPRDLDALLATRPDNTEASRWSLQDVEIGDDYIAALCVRGHGWRLKI
jgi:4'-phosphopantetheinyl transferase